MDIEYKGKTQSIRAWAKELQLHPQTLYSRIRSGWSVVDAFETPTRTYITHFGLIEYNGKVQALAEWIRELGLCKELIRSRLQHGWTAAEAFETPKGRHLKVFGKKDIQIEYQGKTQPLSAWIRELKLNKTLILSRFKSGWTVEEAFEIPKGKGRLRYLRKRLNPVEV